MSTIPAEVVSWEQIDNELFFGTKASSLSGKALEQWQEMIAGAKVLVPVDSSRPQKVAAISTTIERNKSRYTDLSTAYAGVLNRQLPLLSAKLPSVMTRPELSTISSVTHEFGQLATAASVFAGLSNTQASASLGMMAQGAFGLSSSCAALSSGFALGPAGICAASVITIGQGFLGLFAEKESSDGLAQAFGAIFAGLQQISNQIFQLSQFVERKFDELFSKLDEHHREIKGYLENIKDFLGLIEGSISESYLQQLAILDRVIKIDIHHSLARSVDAEHKYKTLLDKIRRNISSNPLYKAENVFADITELGAEFAALQTIYLEASRFVTSNSCEFARFFDFAKFADKSGFVLSALVSANPKYSVLPKLTIPHAVAKNTYETIIALVGKARVLFDDTEITPGSLEDLIANLERELSNHEKFHAGFATKEVQQSLWEQFTKSADDFMTVVSQAAHEQEAALFLGTDPRYNRFTQLPAIASLIKNLEKFKSYEIDHHNPGNSQWFYMFQNEGQAVVYQGYAYDDYVRRRKEDIKTIKDGLIKEVEVLLRQLLPDRPYTHLAKSMVVERDSIALFEPIKGPSAVPRISTGILEHPVDYTKQLRGTAVTTMKEPITRFVLPRNPADPILPIAKKDLMPIPESLIRMEQMGSGEVVLYYNATTTSAGGHVAVIIEVEAYWKSLSSDERLISATKKSEFKFNLNYSRSDAIWLAWAGGENIPTGNTHSTYQVSCAGNRQVFYGPEYGVSRVGFMTDFYMGFRVDENRELKTILMHYIVSIRRGFASDILKKSSSAGPIKSAIDTLMLASTLIQLYLIQHNAELKLEERSAAIFTGLPSYRQLYAFLSGYNGNDIFLDGVLLTQLAVAKQFFSFICGRVNPHITPMPKLAWGKFSSRDELAQRLLILDTKKSESRYQEEYKSGFAIGENIMNRFVSGYLKSYGHELAVDDVSTSYELAHDASMALRLGISAGMNSVLMQSLVRLSPVQFDEARNLLLKIIPKLQELAQPDNLIGRIEFTQEKIGAVDSEAGVRRIVRTTSTTAVTTTVEETSRAVMGGVKV